MTGSVREKSAVARRGLLVGALALLSCAGAASAYTPAGQVGMTIVDRETGREIPVYSHRGRQYIAGQPGGRYSLRVTNNTGLPSNASYTSVMVFLSALSI